MLPDVQTVVWLTDSTAGWLLTYLVHSTVILSAVWLIASRRRVSETVREILWKSALMGGIVTATAQAVVAREPLAGQLRLAPRTAGSVAPAMHIAVRGDVLEARPRIVLLRPGGTRWTNVLVVFWLAMGGGALLLLTLGHARALQALGSRTSLDGTPIGHGLRELLVRAGIDRSVELTCSSAIASPVALPGDEICLPRRALLELQPEEQNGMLAHEVAHLVRRDPQWLVVARAIEMVFFFQPLNRLARRRMQEVAEYLCDDWAVARTRRPVVLAKCLAAVAEWVGPAPALTAPRLHPMSAMVESGGSPLVRRVSRILGGRRAPSARTPRAGFAVSVCALAVLAGVAPRVSVAHPAITAHRFTFLRTVMREHGTVTDRDVLFVFRTPVDRIPFDSLVERGIVRSTP